jgi:EAL domain-containing protein (putative c-di-GMP-specific phosphodiesterase class I)
MSTESALLDLHGPVRTEPDQEITTSTAHSPALTATDLRQALIDNRLRVHYQPLVDLKSGKVRSVEALLRWEHPEYGNLNPEMVVDLAERSGLIGALTDWVMTTALKACAEWRSQGWDFRVSVNATPKLLLDTEFADRVMTILDNTGMPPECLMIEITEGQSITEKLQVLETLARLRLARVNLAIDDFGTGYSSLGRLHSLPFSELKIDKSFVMDTPNDPRQKLIVRAIAQLGRSLGMTVVAEGVSSREAWDLAKSVGCDIAQGYYVSRPLPAETLTEWLYSRDIPKASSARTLDKPAERNRVS